MLSKLYTKIQRPKYDFKINHDDKLLFLGSCFSDNVGKFFEERNFNILRNPFGTIFNPYSTFNIIDKILKNSNFNEHEWFFFNEKWRNFQLHSKCSFHNFEEIKEIEEKINFSHNFIKNADYMFITLGTSWVYVHNKTNKYVGNCHKIPQYEFRRHLLSTDEIIKEGIQSLEGIFNLNPKIKIVFTVSPVRYLSFGPYENSISKSNIFVSISSWLSKFDNIYYFPSYELFLDEMRDYRFYGDDLLHPNDLGISYLWEVICETLLNDTTKIRIKEIENITKFKNHRTFSNFSE